MIYCPLWSIAVPLSPPTVSPQSSELSFPFKSLLVFSNQALASFIAGCLRPALLYTTVRGQISLLFALDRAVSRLNRKTSADIGRSLQGSR